jgi:hypothetical protein
MFWAGIAIFAGQLWTASPPGSFGEFVGSRFFVGFFSFAVGVLGPRMLVDMFFLHQRGRAFTVFFFCFDMGTSAGPPIAAFIATAANTWRWAFWWSAIFQAVITIAMFFCMWDSRWDRQKDADQQERLSPEGYWASRAAIFFPGTRVTPKLSWSEWLSVSLLPLKIAITPVTLLVGLFSSLQFGMFIGMNAITPVWLQKPVAQGGYSFTPMQNAYCKSLVARLTRDALSL